MSDYLKCRNGVFYYYRRIPQACRCHFGNRSVICLSLKTRHKTIAFLRKSDMDMKLENMIHRGKVTMFNQLETIFSHHTSRFEERIIEKPDGTREVVRKVDPESIKALHEAGMDAMQIDAAIDRFYDRVNQVNAAKGLPPEPRPVPSPADITLRDAIPQFNTYRREERQDEPNWQPDKGEDTKFRRLMELLGDDIPLSSITRKDARHVRTQLSKLPKNTASTRGMLISRVIALAEQSGDDYLRMSALQVNNHLDLYALLLEWAMAEVDGFPIQKNPFKSLHAKVTKKQKNNTRRDKFTREDITKIFAHPIFSDYQGYAKRTGKLRPYRYWTPLIGLYTGARPCEIGALLVGDIRKINGVWVFDINDEGHGKCAKTANAIRKTPIHSHLLELGFLDYVKEVKQAGHTRLFPELTYNSKDGYGKYLNDRFVEIILRDTKIRTAKTKNKKVFYSFRHTLTSALHQRKVDQLYREQLCGREATQKSTGDDYYIKDEALPVLRKELEKVDFREQLTAVQSWPSIRTVG